MQALGGVYRRAFGISAVRAKALGQGFQALRVQKPLQDLGTSKTSKCPPQPEGLPIPGMPRVRFMPEESESPPQDKKVQTTGPSFLGMHFPESSPLDRQILDRQIEAQARHALKKRISKF